MSCCFPVFVDLRRNSLLKDTSVSNGWHVAGQFHLKDGWFFTCTSTQLQDMNDERAIAESSEGVAAKKLAAWDGTASH